MSRAMPYVGVDACSPGCWPLRSTPARVGQQRQERSRTRRSGRPRSCRTPPSRSRSAPTRAPVSRPTAPKIEGLQGRAGSGCQWTRSETVPSATCSAVPGSSLRIPLPEGQRAELAPGTRKWQSRAPTPVAAGAGRAPGPRSRRRRGRRSGRSRPGRSRTRRWRPENSCRGRAPGQGPNWPSRPSGRSRVSGCGSGARTPTPARPSSRRLGGHLAADGGAKYGGP